MAATAAPRDSDYNFQIGRRDRDPDTGGVVGAGLPNPHHTNVENTGTATGQAYPSPGASPESSKEEKKASERVVQKAGVATESGKPKGLVQAMLSWLQGSGLLQLAPPWAAWPDYERLNNINAIIAGLWPNVSSAAAELIREQAEPIIADAVKQYGRGIVEAVNLDVLDLGKHPLKLSAMKTYPSGEEQIIMEAPVSWGSSLKVTVSVSLKLLGRSFKIPLTIENFKIYAHSRITARPIMDHYPFIGSFSLTLMHPPYIDFDFPLGGLDVMSLPLVRDTFQFATRLVAKRIIAYPRCYTIETVPGGANPPGPAGMVVVRLIKVSGLKSEDLVGHSDPYVVLQVREGRVLRSRTHHNNNNPEYNEEFTMLVDDPEHQGLRIIVKDDDIFGFSDKVLGVAEVPLKEAPFMRAPRTKIPLTMVLKKFKKPPSDNNPLAIPFKLIGVPVDALARGARIVTKATDSAFSSGGDARRERGRGGVGAYTFTARGAYPTQPSESDTEDYSENDDYNNRTGRQLQGTLGRRRSTSSPNLHYLGPSEEGLNVRQKAAGQGSTPANNAASPAGPKPDDDSQNGGNKPQGTQGQQLQRVADMAHAVADPKKVTEMGKAAAGNLTGQLPNAAGGAATETEGGKHQDKQWAEQAHAEQGLSGTEVDADQALTSKPEGATSSVRGTVFLEVTYLPFQQNRGGGVTTWGAGGSGIRVGTMAGAGGMVRPPGEKADPMEKGILTITLVRASHLSGWTGEPDPYVKFRLYDPTTGKHIEQMSGVVYNEASPRWNEKFDFIMVPAGSQLLATIYDKTTVYEKVVTLKIKDRFKDGVLGRVKVSVLDVATAGRMRNNWPLQGALQGTLEMILEWLPATVAQ